MGFNTDYLGCLETLKNIPLKKKNILIIGCGGAGKACIVAALNHYKDCNFFIFNRNLKKIKIFIKEIKIKHNRVNVLKNYEQLLGLKKMNLVINTSSVGFNSWINRKNKYLNLKFFSPLCDLRKIKMIALLTLLCPTLTRSNDFFDCEQASRQISDAELAT